MSQILLGKPFKVGDNFEQIYGPADAIQFMLMPTVETNSRRFYFLMSMDKSHVSLFITLYAILDLTKKLGKFPETNLFNYIDIILFNLDLCMNKLNRTTKEYNGIVSCIYELQDFIIDVFSKI